LRTQVGLSCQVVSEIVTNGDPYIEGQLLKNDSYLRVRVHPLICHEVTEGERGIALLFI